MVASQARPAYIYDTTLGDWVPMSGVVDTGQSYTFTANQTFNGLVNANNGINSATTLNLQTGGTTGLTIDSSRRVTTPNNPSFLAYRTGAWETVSGTVVFGSTAFNIGGNYSTSTGRFTAPVAGLYSFTYVFYSSLASTQWAFKRNGSDYVLADTYLAAEGSATDTSINSTLGIYLNIGDYISCGPRTTNSNSTYNGHTFFGGYLVG